MDKASWQAIVDANYAIPQNQSVETLTSELLSYLGSTDFDLRDVFGYPILAEWIGKGYYSSNQLRVMIEQLTSNLKVGLGEQGTDTVFLRAFSALVLAEIVYYDLQHPFLEEAEVRKLLQEAVTYFSGERDLRGYVPGPGWAHAVAHGADLLALLAQNRYVGTVDLENLMDAIAGKVAPAVAHVYLYNEDQRLIRAVLSALQRDMLSLDFLMFWLDRLTHYEGQPVGITMLFAEDALTVKSEVEVCVLHNTKQFLSGLYYHLALTQQPLTDTTSFIAKTPSVPEEFLQGIVVALRPMNVF